MEETIIIQFEKSVQITEDSWRVVRKSLKVHNDTTVMDIRKWAIKENEGREPDTLFILKASVI